MVEFSLISHLFEKLKNEHSYVVFAESLTGGLISSELSKMPGSSEVFWGGLVVYNSLAKRKLLAVPKTIIDECGVVSEECALSMACGALKASFEKGNVSPKYSLAVTGVAGPPSQFDEKKVGTVYIAIAKILNAPHYANSSCYDVEERELELHSIARLFHFQGDRNAVREQTLNNGIKMLIDF